MSIPSARPSRRRPALAPWLRTLATGLLAVVLLAPGAAAAADDEQPSPVEHLDLPPGQRVDGGDEGAPSLLRPGWSRAVLAGGASGEGTLHFTYRRDQVDSTLLISLVSHGATSTGTEGLRLRVVAPDGTQCASETSSRYEQRQTLAVRVVVGRNDPREESTGAACESTGFVRITVERSQDQEEPADTPVAVRVVEEAPPTAPDDLAEPQERPSPTGVDTDATPEDLDGGADPASAPLIGAGVYRGRIEAGGVLAYRVRLDWGESIAAEVVAPGLSEADLERFDDYGPRLVVAAADPMLVGGRDETSGDSLGQESSTTLLRTGAVDYLARYESGTGYYLPGEYLLSIEAPAATEPVTVEYTLRLQIDNDGAAAPALGDQPAYLVAPGERVDSVPIAPGIAGDDERSMPRTVAGVALSAVGSLAVLGGALMLRRRVRP